MKWLLYEFKASLVYIVNSRRQSYKVRSSGSLKKGQGTSKLQCDMVRGKGPSSNNYLRKASRDAF